jgi:imidazole glycerol phosphate synthase subunit HisF
MPPVGFEPTISAGKRPQTYALDHADNGIGEIGTYCMQYDGEKPGYFGVEGNIPT